MLNTWVRLLTATALAVGCSVVNAQAPGCQRTQIYFVNGVWNDTYEKAHESSVELTLALMAEGIDLNPYGPQFGPAIQTFWNPGDGELSDVLEALRNYHPAAGFVYRYGALAPIAFTEFAAQLQRRYAGLPYRPEFEVQIENFRGQLLNESQNRRPVLVVAHSQGNILANRAIATLLSRYPDLADAIAVVGVAVADQSPPNVGHYGYVTVNQDKVIRYLPYALPGNFMLFNSGTGTDPVLHAFVPTYLSTTLTGFFGQSSAPLPMRGVLSGLVREGLEYVNCAATTTTVQNTPLTALVGMPLLLSAQTSLAPGAPGRLINGTTTFLDLAGVTLCSAATDPVTGIANCAVTYQGRPRNEGLQAKFVGNTRNGDSNSQSVSVAVKNGGMLGAQISISRRYPDTDTPLSSWLPATITPTVLAGITDTVTWRAGTPEQVYAVVNPEAQSIQFELMPSRYLADAKTFDGFIVSGFPHPIRSASVVTSSELGVISSFTPNEVRISLSGAMTTNGSVTVYLEFEE